MSNDPRSTTDLWGWLVPGVGLAIVGVALLLNGAPIAAPMVILGLVLCIVGLVKHQRANSADGSPPSPPR